MNAPSAASGAEVPIRVLHVDDEPDFAGLTAAFLERESEGTTVETATTAAEGLRLLAEERFDCVVSDYNLAETDGLAFFESVRDAGVDVPFILFTGRGSEEIASEAISTGVSDYLQKETGTGQYAVLANRIRNAVDQHRSRTALETSQKRLALFVEQSPLGVLEYDENFRIVAINGAAAEILGYTEDELRGHTWEKIVADASYESVDAVTSALMKSEGGYYSVDENVRKNGERIVCEWHNRVVTDEHGEMVAVFSQFRDISERHRREERLRRTTARLEALFENSPDMINIHDQEGVITEANPELCAKTGYDADELVGTSVWDLDDDIHPDEAQALWANMTAGDRSKLEGSYRRRDGSSFPVEVHIRRLALNGEDRFLVISRDISERVERERRLEETTNRYRTLVENVPDGGVFLFDKDLRYTLVGGEELRSIGVSADDFLGKGPHDLFPAALADELEHYYQEALAGNDHTFEQRLDGEEYRIRTLPIRGDDGVDAGMAMSQNVTEQRQQERKLRQQKESLAEFASVVSHDLRNPLNVAEGHLELIDTDDADSLDAVRRAHRRMRTLIEDVLTLAREGAAVESLDDVELAAAVEASWLNVETGEASLAVDTDRAIRADESRLRQLFENLFRNAVEHGARQASGRSAPGDSVEHSSTSSRATPDDAVEHSSTGDSTASDEAVTVTVGALPDGFFVADDGPGIPAESRESVFEAGYSTSRDGTGFGLRIVEQIAEAHGWSVALTESETGGARFEFSGVAPAAE
ncbi:PAS domain S-box protein [Halogeometricum sp. S1BR25-6]|uniref:histidine kinase n=1 Tax=Halogeometricum salsisoli TaxID=2950536 RepID=A0ABU2GE68_9EURY|nr:PAS domain S-box protein [Halogeometricum sp. S1BR25-6]MDS0299102.1 PAS domain S-box protein [Halogeometricum sp. S1BR25-6]